MYNDPKRHMRGIVSGKIQKCKSNLEQVKNCIEQDFQRPLSPIDNAYIQRKYIKYCSNFWLTEITDILRELIDNKSRDTIHVVFTSLDNIESLCDVPNLFKRREYYKLLIQHYQLVSKEDEAVLISRFKKECLEQIVAYTETAEKELQFLKALVDFVSGSPNLRTIIAELKLEDFCRGGLSFAEFLRRIINFEENTCGESLTVLQEAAECLQQEKDLFLIDKINKVISAYIKPIEIEEKIIDNRLVIEVKERNVVISEILQQIENKLSANSNIEEVRFVGADIIYIDTNFENRIWHGKNIAILAKAIKICNEVTWNVSGKDNNHIYSNNAGTEEDGHGKPGADGYPGESGGNVSLLAEKIENPENFTIISNGGKGSKGQDGGNGKNGKDGKGISKAEFDKKFPIVSGFKLGSISPITTVLDSIIQDYSEINKFWYTGTGTTIHDIVKYIHVQTERAGRIPAVPTRYDFPVIEFKHKVFIEAMTNEGNEITFSFESGGWFTSCQAFLLYKGSFGQPGGHRGECGLGGDGGYAGDIIVKNLENSGQEFGIMKNAKQGKEGENGQSGKNGRNGKNGLDMGYLDYIWWTKAKFRNQGKYKVEYYDRDNSPSDRVWCPKYEKYAGIIAVNNEHREQKKYEERKSTEQNNHRQRRTQAVRKKNISQHSISTNYSNNFSSIEKDILQNLRSDLDGTKKEALRAIAKNQEQLLEKQTIELGIKRCVNFTS